MEDADSAEILRVRPVSAHDNVEVSGFTLTTMQAIGHRLAGTLEKYVRAAPYTFMRSDTRKLATRCSEANDYRGLAVELKAPADQPVAASSFVIDYEIDGTTRSVTTETAFTFCAGDERDEDIAGEDDDVDIDDCRESD